MASNLYQYYPLNSERHEIRLLQVRRLPQHDRDVSSDLRVDFRSTIECHLSIFELASAPPYKALSYTWGPETDPHHAIKLNDRDYEVRGNLYNFLCYFRVNKVNEPDVYIWVDQLCINQMDIAERNTQVPLMSKIYTGCTNVIAWLGSGEELAAAAESWLTDCDALCLLLNQPYWRRLWIVQEMLLPPKVEMLCGSDWISLTAMYGVVSGRYPPLPNGGDVVERCPFETIMMLNEYVWNRRKTTTLQESIQRYSGYLCHDKRDKVYGLLGWVTDADSISPDYNKPVSEVFVDAVRCLSKKHERPWPHPDRAPVFFKTSLVLARELGITAHQLDLLAKCLVEIENVEP